MHTNFLDILWPTKPNASLSTWMKKTNSIRFFHASQFDEAHDYMIANAPFDEVYFTVTLLHRQPPKGRGAASDAGYLSCLHADFDIDTGNEAHAKTALPKSATELFEFLETSNIPTPTINVNSGNGIHSYWVLEKPIDLTTDVGRTTGASVLKEFQRSIIALAKQQRGWELDNTGDLARALRYPSTRNHKSTPFKSVEIM